MFRTNNDWEVKIPEINLLAPEGTRTYHMIEVPLDIPLLFVDIQIEDREIKLWRHYILGDVPHALNIVISEAVKDFRLSFLMPDFKNGIFEGYKVKEVERIYEGDAKGAPQKVYLYVFTDGTQYFDLFEKEEDIENKNLIFLKEK